MPIWQDRSRLHYRPTIDQPQSHSARLVAHAPSPSNFGGSQDPPNPPWFEILNYVNDLRGFPLRRGFPFTFSCKGEGGEGLEPVRGKADDKYGSSAVFLHHKSRRRKLREYLPFLFMSQARIGFVTFLQKIYLWRVRVLVTVISRHSQFKCHGIFGTSNV